MHHLRPHRSPIVFPRGVEGGLVSLLKPTTRLSLVAVEDIGRPSAAAIAAPDGLYKMHGCRFAPRFRDLVDQRFWRADGGR